MQPRHGASGSPNCGFPPTSSSSSGASGPPAQAPTGAPPLASQPQGYGPPTAPPPWTGYAPYQPPYQAYAQPNAPYGQFPYNSASGITYPPGPPQGPPQSYASPYGQQPYHPAPGRAYPQGPPQAYNAPPYGYQAPPLGYPAPPPQPGYAPPYPAFYANPPAHASAGAQHQPTPAQAHPHPPQGADVAPTATASAEVEAKAQKVFKSLENRMSDLFAQDPTADPKTIDGYEKMVNFLKKKAPWHKEGFEAILFKAQKRVKEHSEQLKADAACEELAPLPDHVFPWRRKARGNISLSDYTRYAELKDPKTKVALTDANGDTLRQDPACAAWQFGLEPHEDQRWCYRHTLSPKSCEYHGQPDGIACYANHDVHSDQLTWLVMHDRITLHYANFVIDNINAKISEDAQTLQRFSSVPLTFSNGKPSPDIPDSERA